MAKKKIDKTKLLSEARKMFVDAKEYNPYELLGYYRLVKYIYKKQQETLEGEIQIATMKEILNSLDERTYEIVRWRYWEGKTRQAIGQMLGITGERVRQIDDAVWARLAFVIKKVKFITVEQVVIEYLNLSSRAYLSLKRVGINTIGELVKLNQHDLLEIAGIGPTVNDEIKKKLSDFMMRNAPEQQSDFETFPIDALNFSHRVNNALKRKGIVTIRQLFNMMSDELYLIRGIGTKGVDEICNKKQEIITKYQYA